MAQIILAFVIAAILQTCTGAPNNHTRAHIDLPIRYPGPMKSVELDRYGSLINNIPTQCMNLTFCTVKPDDYPDDDIRRLFGNKKVQVSSPELQLDFDIGNRQADDPNEEDNCPSHVEYQPIYNVKSDGKWQTVVQAPELAYEQKVRMEICNGTPGKSCFNVATFPSNVRTKCHQKHATWKLQVLDENKKLVLKEVNLPSCCSCYYYFNDS